ncbi:Fc.00g063890.m01.CDS01 [Cosmosporella sp. VM-42]
MVSLLPILSTIGILLSLATAYHHRRDTATIYEESTTYDYYGCYNETTDIDNTAKNRALDGGTHMVKKGTMTVPMCLNFCTSNNTEYTYAGLEWSRCIFSQLL